MFLFRDAISMIREINAKGFAISLWGRLLNIPQIVGGLVFIMTIEGAAVLVTVFVTLMIAGQIHQRAPFSRLIGLCHLPWLILLPWLVYRLFNFEHSILLTAWLVYVAVTILISLVFDILDAYRFSRGDRVYAWARQH